MSQAPDGTAGRREPVQVPGVPGSPGAAPAGSLASGASSRSPSVSARAKFSSLTYPESASTVRSWGRCGLGQLLAAGAWQRVQQSAVDRVLGQHCADDDLLCCDHELPVVPGHVPFWFRITRTSGSVMFARGSVLLRLLRGSSAGR